MGEFADMAIDEMLSVDEWEQSNPDDYDSSEDGVFYRRPRKELVCKYCGKKNLIWKKLDGKWRLHEIMWLDKEYLDHEWIPHTCTYKGVFGGRSSR